MKHRNPPDRSTYRVDRRKLALDRLDRVVPVQSQKATKPKLDADLVTATTTPE